ncbi:hypothetical protein [Candidatus Electronema sp. TJ]|uniref:hypothetical protein n=1 Tax=Candidatus Electronema sp. TJ TaxID=3401573 RepID=UPI003AA7F21E
MNGINMVHFQSTSMRGGLARHLSQLFKTGEIWGVDCWTLDRELALRHGNFPYLLHSNPEAMGVFPCATFEEIFIKTLENYLKFANERLQLSLPVKLIVGATDVKGFMMATCYGVSSRFLGNVVEEHLIKEMIIDNYDTPPRTILRPFFEYVWEECGLTRPDKECLG